MVQWLCFFKHDLKLSSKETQQSGISTVSGEVDAGGGTTGPPGELEDSDQEYDDTAAGFCCWKGCITGALAVFLFFIVFPAGVLMINYSHNKKDTAVLSVGILLTVLPLFALALIILVIFRRRKLIKRQRQKVAQTSP